MDGSGSRAFATTGPRLGCVGAALLAGFALLYSWTGLELSRTGSFRVYDLFFQLDPPRAIDDMTEFSGRHYRTRVHPVYVLLVNPFGTLIKRAVGSKNEAAILLNSCLGASAVAVAFLFFWLFGRDVRNAALLAVAFGSSMGQFLLSAVPDTATLAILGLQLNYLLLLYGLRYRRQPRARWIAAGILTLGVTTTNFAQSLICFSVLAWVLAEEKRTLVSLRSPVLRFALSVIGITVALATLQKLLYPHTVLFFLPEAYRDEHTFASGLVFSQPGLVAGLLLKHFFLVNIAAPSPHLLPEPGRSVFQPITFADSWDYSWIGVGGAALWLAAWLGGVVRATRARGSSPLFVGLALCVLVNWGLHSFYGVGEKGRIEYFLYSGNFSFAVFAFLAPHAADRRRGVRLLLWLLPVALALNNVQVMRRILDLYARPL